MKDAFFRYFPIVTGVLLGLLAVSPPQILGLSLPVRLLVGAPAAAILFVFFAYFMISAALPHNLQMTPIDPKMVTEHMMDVFLAFQDAGFQLAGPPLRVETAPAAILVPLIDSTGQVYGTIFRTGTQPPKTACDMVTLFAHPKAGLTTGANPEGASLPAPPGSFFQVFTGADVSTLYRQHIAALELLKKNGLQVKPATPQSFPDDFREAISEQRRHFMTNPIWHTLVVIYRSSSGSTPHLGPIQQQAIASATLQRLRGSGAR